MLSRILNGVKLPGTIDPAAQANPAMQGGASQMAGSPGAALLASLAKLAAVNGAGGQAPTSATPVEPPSDAADPAATPVATGPQFSPSAPVITGPQNQPFKFGQLYGGDPTPKENFDSLEPSSGPGFLAGLGPKPATNPNPPIDAAGPVTRVDLSNYLEELASNDKIRQNKLDNWIKALEQLPPAPPALQQYIPDNKSRLIMAALGFIGNLADPEGAKGTKALQTWIAMRNEFATQAYQNALEQHKYDTLTNQRRVDIAKLAYDGAVGHANSILDRLNAARLINQGLDESEYKRGLLGVQQRKNDIAEAKYLSENEIKAQGLAVAEQSKNVQSLLKQINAVPPGEARKTMYELLRKEDPFYSQLTDDQIDALSAPNAKEQLIANSLKWADKTAQAKVARLWSQRGLDMASIKYKLDLIKNIPEQNAIKWANADAQWLQAKARWQSVGDLDRRATAREIAIATKNKVDALLGVYKTLYADKTADMFGDDPERDRQIEQIGGEISDSIAAFHAATGESMPLPQGLKTPADKTWWQGIVGDILGSAATPSAGGAPNFAPGNRLTPSPAQQPSPSAQGQEPGIPGVTDAPPSQRFNQSTNTASGVPRVAMRNFETDTAIAKKWIAENNPTVAQINQLRRNIINKYHKKPDF